jgi:deoxyxylulose-5-phosphate synthase
MRRALAEELCSIAEIDNRLVFITGDLGFCVFDEFRQRFPDRYFNVGIAEAGAIGVAAGLASKGFVPVVYSIASFLNSRAYEQIRFFSAVNEFRIILIGAGSGFNYGNSGPTHHALDDIGLARMIPGLEVYTPIGPSSLRRSIRLAITSDTSSYIPIGKYGEKDLKIKTLTSNSTCGIIAYASSARMFNEFEDIADYFESRCDFYFLETFSELHESPLFEFVKRHENIILVEDQFFRCGIAIEILRMIHACGGMDRTFKWFGPAHHFTHENLSEMGLREFHGYTPKQIIDYLEQMK